nr:hypothetical protein BaRGS_034171 [Batillaria attramentaria]
MLRVPVFRKSVLITLSILDEDTSRQELVDTFQFSYAHDNPVRNRLLSAEDYKKSVTTLTGQRPTEPSSLRVAVAVMCDRFYYSDNCSVNCVASDDCGGHYDCDVITGARTCLKGWGGDSCNVQLSTDHGCREGFTGDTCDAEVVSATCPENYYGPACSMFCKEEDSCDAGQYTCDPVNGARVCRFGWIGPLCNVRDPEAMHDVECPNSECRNARQSLPAHRDTTAQSVTCTVGSKIRAALDTTTATPEPEVRSVGTDGPDRIARRGRCSRKTTLSVPVEFRA